ncbi:MAG: hypothetical protein ACRD50_08390 [Candidatus Acidiferrales bacterium]
MRRILYLLTALLLLGVAPRATAQDNSQAQTAKKKPATKAQHHADEAKEAEATPPEHLMATPPPVLVMHTEEIKMGKAMQYEDLSAKYAALFGKLKPEFHYIGMYSMSGPSRAVYLVPFGSLADMSSTMQAVFGQETPGSELARLDAETANTNEEARDAVFLLRPDLSYEPGVDISKLRYFAVETFRVRPGHDREFDEGGKLFQDAYKKSGIEAHYAIFQALYGAPEGTYLIFEPIASLADVDKEFSQMGALMGAMGDGAKRLDEISSSAINSDQSDLYGIDPHISNPPEGWAKADPGFWRPKPTKPAAAKEEKPKAQ